MVSRPIDPLTRRHLVRRIAAAAGGLFGLAALGPQAARAAEDCRRVVSYRIYTSSTCRAQFGNIDCYRSSVNVFSPNNAYQNYWVCQCGPEPCKCSPYYVQARAGVCNGGSCSRECVPATPD